MASLFITSLNSGSNGNCYYIGNDTDAILVDAGISCRETERRLSRLGLSASRIRGIFISHEHADHITGLAGLSKKYNIPVYITPPTWVGAGLPLTESLVREFRPFEPIMIGDLTITAFPKFHDACDPHSFVVSSGNIRIGIFTDIGQTCENLVAHFSTCHAAFLEANYDTEMLNNGSYPYFLKRRIMGGQGHLSNNEALELVKRHKPAYMTHLILSHLSKNNNCPDLVQKLCLEHAGDTQIIVASRYKETPVYHISSDVVALTFPARRLPATPKKAQVQLSLF